MRGSEEEGLGILKSSWGDEVDGRGGRGEGMGRGGGVGREARWDRVVE